MKLSRALPVVLFATASVALAADPWKHYRNRDTEGLAGDEIQFIQPIGEDVWIGTADGLTRFRDGQFTKVTQMAAEAGARRKDGEGKTEPQPFEHTIWEILPDGEDTFLVATSKGVFRMKDAILREKVYRGTLTPLLRRGENTLWGKAGGRIVARNEDGWKALHELRNKRIIDMLQVPSGDIWIILDGDGALRVKPDQDLADAAHEHRGMNIRMVFEDSKERAWVGFWDGGVAVLDDGRWTQYLDWEETAVLRFAEDKAGNIWIASNQALWRYDGEEFEAMVEDQGPINLLYATSDARIWMSTQRFGGLHYRDNGEWKPSLDQRVPIRCMVELDDGTLCAGGILTGVYILPR